MFDYVCVKKEYDLVSNRVQVLETLSGFKSHASVIKSCILIQKKFRLFVNLLKIKRVRENISQKVILKYTKQFVKKKKTNLKNLLLLKLKNKLRTICYKKRFHKMKTSSIYIQYMFRKSLRNISYSLKCSLLREIQYLKQKVDEKNYVINELKKKIKKEQSMNLKTSNKWHRRNILNNLINIDVA